MTQSVTCPPGEGVLGGRDGRSQPPARLTREGRGPGDGGHRAWRGRGCGGAGLAADKGRRGAGGGPCGAPPSSPPPPPPPRPGAPRARPSAGGPSGAARRRDNRHHFRSARLPLAPPRGSRARRRLSRFIDQVFLSTSLIFFTEVQFHPKVLPPRRKGGARARGPDTLARGGESQAAVAPARRRRGGNPRSRSLPAAATRGRPAPAPSVLPRPCGPDLYERATWARARGGPGRGPRRRATLLRRWRRGPSACRAAGLGWPGGIGEGGVCLGRQSRGPCPGPNLRRPPVREPSRVAV